jgi:predicted ArsR family transcriptional regulator
MGSIEVHKALADDTRFRLYRYLRLSGRPVSVRELSTALSLHANTLRPHLRRLEEAGLVAREANRTAAIGRPQTLYTALGGDEPGGAYRLIAEVLAGLVRGPRGIERAEALAREWGEYLVAQDAPRPGSPPAARRARHLATLQEAMARAGFDPRFRRVGKRRVDVSLRDCPARDLAAEHGDLICAVHRGLIAGMLTAVRPRLRLAAFEPLAERGICRAALHE